MLELIFQGFLEWAYGLALECWQYFSTALLDIMSMDFAYLKSHAPVVDEIMQILLAVGWALLIGNLVFQALKSMAVGLGFEGEDPKLLFARTFVFAFLLLASPQICEIGLSMTSKIIELLQIPDAVNVTFVDESVFGAIGAAWLLVIIFGIIVMFKVFKLLLEIAERYVILAMLTITAPLAFAMGGSKSTSEIFTGWCRMFGSMCLLMVTNVIFFKMLLSVLATVPSGLDVLPWIVLILTIVKVARKADAIVTRIGLNPAITGDSLGRGLPGTLTYMVVRSAASQITKAVGKSAGNGGKGAAPNAPSGGPAWAGPAEVMATRRSMSGKAQRSKAAQIKAHHRNRLMRKAPQYIQARRNHPRRKSPPHLLRRTVCLKIRQRQGPRRNGKVLFLSAHAALRHISRLQQRYRLSVCRMHPADPVRQEKLALRHAPVWRERQRLFKAACAPQPRSA